MDVQQKNSPTEESQKESIRPALIVSKRTVYEYSMFLRRFLVGLVDESVPVALICRPDFNAESVAPPTVEIIRHPVFDLPLMWRRNRKLLVERLADFKPTVLHCLCRSKAVLTMRLARQLDLPYVLTVNSLQKRLRPLFVSSSRCAKITVPTESIAANLARLYPRFSERVERINIGTFAGDASGCFLEAGRLATMVTVCPLNKVENFEKLFGAVRHLVIDGYEFMFVVAGGGPAQKHLRKLLTALGLLQTVIIVPKLTSWRSILAAGDIYIQPRPSDAFDPFLLEAMSVGSAVAGCKGGVDDLIIDGRTAVVFDHNDELSIYGSLQRLFDRPEFAQKLAQGAQAYVRQNHSVSKMVSDILRTYRQSQRWYEHQGQVRTADSG